MNFDEECLRSIQIQEKKYKEKISLLEAKLKITRMKLKFETDLRMKSEEERDKIKQTLWLKSTQESRRTKTFLNSSSDDDYMTAANSFVFTENDLNESNLLPSTFRKHQGTLQNSNIKSRLFESVRKHSHFPNDMKSLCIYSGLNKLKVKYPAEPNPVPEQSPMKNHNWRSEVMCFDSQKSAVNYRSEKLIKSRNETFKMTPIKNSYVYFSPRRESTPLPQNLSSTDSSLDRCTLLESNNEHSISRLAPLIPPMIPMAIIHSIDEIERRGLKEIGLYRMAGDEEDILSLYEKFENFETDIDLSEINVHSIATFLKSFLCNFPLVPKTFHDMFSQIIFENDRDELYYAISALPQANRDTLAYLIIHLRRVSFAAACKMPASKLSAVFTPIVFGLRTCDKENQSSDVPINVMEELLKLPSSYWNSFIVDPTRSETPTKLRNSPSTEQIVRKKANKFFSTNVHKKKFFV